MGFDPREALKPRVLSATLLAGVDAGVQYWFQRGAVDDWQDLLDEVARLLSSGSSEPDPKG